MKTWMMGTLLTLLVAAPAWAAKVQITSPVKDEKCGVTITVEAKMDTDGQHWPVVFVKPMDFNFPYYAQENVAAVDGDGAFSAAAQLGELDSVAGTKFTVIVVLVKDKEEADKYTQGKTLDKLPVNVGSARVVVSRK